MGATIWRLGSRLKGTLLVPNPGTLIASSSVIRFYPSTDTTLSADDLLLDEIRLAPLGPQQNIKFLFHTKLKKGQSAIGKFVIAVLDANATCLRPMKPTMLWCSDRSDVYKKRVSIKRRLCNVAQQVSPNRSDLDLERSSPQAARAFEPGHARPCTIPKSMSVAWVLSVADMYRPSMPSIPRTREIPAGVSAKKLLSWKGFRWSAPSKSFSRFRYNTAAIRSTFKQINASACDWSLSSFRNVGASARRAPKSARARAASRRALMAWVVRFRVAAESLRVQKRLVLTTLPVKNVIDDSTGSDTCS